MVLKKFLFSQTSLEMEGGYITGNHPYTTMDSGAVKRARMTVGGLIAAGGTALTASVPQIRDYVVETVKSEAKQLAKRKLQDVQDVFSIARRAVSRLKAEIVAHNENVLRITRMRGKKFHFEMLGNKFPLFT